MATEICRAGGGGAGARWLRRVVRRAPATLLLFALLAGAGAAAARLGAAPQDRARSEVPNIIVVLIDDLGYGDLSAYGTARVKTPNIDRLAAEGIRFEQYYANSPICSPSRTALITGQYPGRWRINSYIDNRALNRKRGMADFLDPAAPTLARLLAAGGYRTGHFGKWHLGGGRDVGDAPLISEYGFDASLTQFEGLGDRVLPIFDPHDGSPARRAPLGEASERLGRGTITWRDRCQVTAAFVDAAWSFVGRAQADGRPFYVNLWPDDVHSPFFPPAEHRGDGSKQARYDGTLVNMDAQLGVLFDRVRNDPRLRDRTVIVVTSDNGPEPGAGTAGPLRGVKASLYEGGVRAPLIVWSPGLLQASARGSRNSASVLSAADLVPSLLRLARIEAPRDVRFDGVDVSPALVGRDQSGREPPLFWKRPPDRPGPAEDPWPDLAVRDGKWKLLVEEDGSDPQLYDLHADAAESRNLAADQPTIVDRLRREVLAWDASLPK